MPLVAGDWASLPAHLPPSRIRWVSPDVSDAEYPVSRGAGCSRLCRGGAARARARRCLRLCRSGLARERHRARFDPAGWQQVVVRHRDRRIHRQHDRGRADYCVASHRCRQHLCRAARRVDAAQAEWFRHGSRACARRRCAGPGSRRQLSPERHRWCDRSRNFRPRPRRADRRSMACMVDRRHHRRPRHRACDPGMGPLAPDGNGA